MAASLIQEDWTGEDVSVSQIERELARLRDVTSEEGAQPNLRTSVMTHIAWVPQEWQSQAEETLAGMAERHPSRTLLLVPDPDAEAGLDAQVSIRCFPIGDRAICGEVIELRLRGNRMYAPASIVLPLLISDLPVFCRWRGAPPFGRVEFEQMVDVADRLIVDSGEWRESQYDELAAIFGRTAVSDIAWARTREWRLELARYWPGIREQEIRIRGPRAEATLLRAWLNTRLDRAIHAIDEAPALAVRLGGEELPSPRTPTPSPSDLLSAELDRFGRDPVFEDAVRAAG
ncbi:MAG TPA: glucose-6-phosphate dehydrogenase assembly protein OpcA [Gaiellaceae bacterium]|nr:glucose-6-phosphate dehydrogenase assembly protein OpcA [Gaiellaceae bacterium]